MAGLSQEPTLETPHPAGGSGGNGSRDAGPRFASGDRFGHTRAGDPAAADGTKLAARIAARLEAEIMRRRWPVGEVLGSEGQLIEELDVSRAVFREAVRIVESHQVASMRRGPNGGLVVTAPNVSAAQASAALFLDYSGVQRADLLQVRSALELTCIRHVVERLDESVVGKLREALAEEEQEINAHGLTPHGVHLHQAIAELSGNPALALFVDILMRLMQQRSTKRVPNGTKFASDMHHAHALIVEAIIEGDIGLAQYRMGRHLGAIAGLDFS